MNVSQMCDACTSGGSRGGTLPPPLSPLFWVKKEKSQKEEKPTGQVKQNHPHLHSHPPRHLAQGLGPPMCTYLLGRLVKVFRFLLATICNNYHSTGEKLNASIMLETITSVNLSALETLSVISSVFVLNNCKPWQSSTYIPGNRKTVN